jgi:hypothetical protein
MNLRSILLTTSFAVCAFSVQAQRGLSFGPSVSFGQVLSRNSILSDTSEYYVKNAPGLFGSGGLDVIFGVDDHVSIHVGAQYNFKQFKLQPKDNATGESYPDLVDMAKYISIPMAVHYRLPLKEGGSTFINFMAGHTLDMIKLDSALTATNGGGAADSGSAYSRRWIRYDKHLMPTVTLGVGLNFCNAKNSALDISVVWGIGTGKMIRGDIKEWKSLNRDFDPALEEEPNQFPTSYFDYAMRGSYLSLRISYWFNTGLFIKKQEVEVPKEEKPLPPLNDDNQDIEKN